MLVDDRKVPCRLFMDSYFLHLVQHQLCDNVCQVDCNDSKFGQFLTKQKVLILVQISVKILVGLLLF